MTYSFSVPSAGDPGFIRYLLALATDLMKFLVPALYCRSWAPWVRIMITVLVIVLLVVCLPLLGQLLPPPGI